jgi:hypothetical protein
MGVVTTVLEIIGVIVVVTGAAVAAALAVATVAPDPWGWPAGLMVWGAGAFGATWFLDRLTEGGDPE